MSLQDRIESLKAKHAELDVELETEESRPHPDELHAADLKKQKLRLKDEITTLEAGH